MKLLKFLKDFTLFEYFILLLYTQHTMSSPGQKRGSCGHAMAGFDGHSFCARCREKGKGEEPCIANTTECKFCNLFSPEQWAQLATPSYKLKKEKRDAKRVDNPTPTEDIALVDPASVSVIGAVGGAASSQSPSVPPEKKTKNDKPPLFKYGRQIFRTGCKMVRAI